MDRREVAGCLQRRAGPCGMVSCGVANTEDERGLGLVEDSNAPENIEKRQNSYRSPVGPGLRSSHLQGSVDAMLSSCTSMSIIHQLHGSYS